MLSGTQVLLLRRMRDAEDVSQAPRVGSRVSERLEGQERTNANRAGMLFAIACQLQDRRAAKERFRHTLIRPQHGDHQARHIVRPNTSQESSRPLT